jgi:uncharacterized membrane protein YkoI
MKKNIQGMIIGAMVGLTVLGGAGSVLAAGITQEKAQKTALEAAGVKEEDVIFKKTGKEFDDGREFFEVDFFIPGEMKYEYDIDAATGAILEQDKEQWEAEDDFEYADLIESAAKETKAANGEISEDEAKAIALKDAGLKEKEVKFTKCKKDLDDGIEKFEIEFRTADFMEYEYDISAADGTILEKNAEFDD